MSDQQTPMTELEMDTLPHPPVHPADTIRSQAERIAALDDTVSRYYAVTLDYEAKLEAAEQELARANKTIDDTCSELGTDEFSSKPLAAFVVDLKAELAWAREELRVFTGLATFNKLEAEKQYERANSAERRLSEVDAVLQELVAWNTRYPSSRIYNETSIRRIAAEMDDINVKARAALSRAGNEDRSADESGRLRK